MISSITLKLKKIETRPVNTGFSLLCSFELAMTSSNIKSFPPVDDAISFIKDIDWTDVRQRTRRGLNNVGLVIAVVGEKIHDLGSFLA